MVEADGDVRRNGSLVLVIEDDGDVRRSGSLVAHAGGCCDASAKRRLAAALYFFERAIFE